MALARALMVALQGQASGDHTIFLLDEISSNLDLQVAEEIFADLFRLPESTFVLTSHSPQTLKHCDRLIVIRDKTLYRLGTYAELLDDPYCRGLIE